MKKLIVSTLLFFVAGTVAFAQEKATRPCATYTAMDEAFEMYPGLKEHYEANQLLINSINPNPEKSGALYTIPVVWHILHEYGTENIDDSQIYNAMEIINREFNAADPDSVDVVPEFDTLIGNGRIEFKLATIDPAGNCTNGIVHEYTHETRNGDAFSKLHQWDRSKYLNIWVIKVSGVAGAAAYALKPAATDGNAFWMDGIVALHYYVGNTGTSSVTNETTITHEIAHYLNVDHVWGGTNDPEVVCGDDGVADTPKTGGHSPGNCPLTLAAQAVAPFPNCNGDTILEDVQNYMDYSYCSRHFTPGQIEFFHNALNGIAGQRNIIWQDSTLIATGVINETLPQTALTVPLCTPIPDFYSSSKTTCVGSPMTFNDATWNAVVDSREWIFQDGNPATSTSLNPTVTFTTPGWKTVTLKSTNATGTGVETRQSYIYVYPGWADYSGPAVLDIETSRAEWFRVNNIEENWSKFQISQDGGYNNSRCYKLNVYKDVQNADMFTDDFFYNNRLGLQKDELITPSFDLRYTTGITFKFKYSYATNATTPADETATLKVYSSKDCGNSWQLRKSIPSSQIINAGFAGNVDFKPTQNSQWTESSFSYNSTSTDDKTIFKFEFEASDKSSNLYIDDIMVEGTLSLTSDQITLMDLNVFPNPTNSGTAINISYKGQDEEVTFTLRNAQGKVITTETVEATSANVSKTLNNTNNLSAACYFLEIRSGDYTTVRKVVVL